MVKVKVISGSHKGEEGKILDVKRSQNLVFIEGLNLVIYSTCEFPS